MPAVLEEVRRFLEIEYGNEGSRTHSYGAVARKRVNLAREEVASLVAAEPGEVIFTSGATEANNLAILGLAEALVERGQRHVVTSSLEHKAVLEPVSRLQAQGFEVTLVDADVRGRVDPKEILAAVGPQTGLISLMHANNETGTIQPVGEVAAGLPEHVYLHVDAAQSLGTEFKALAEPRIDMISGSAHKLHGPKGVGALIARRRDYRRPPLAPLMVGGGQEQGLRPGTIPVHLVAGLGTAARSAMEERIERARSTREFRKRTLVGLQALDPVVNGDPDQTLTHVLNVSFPGIDAEAAILASKDLVAISNGSACTSRSYERSHVLTAMGLDPALVDGALRISWCHLTPEPDWLEFNRRLVALRTAAY